MNAGLLAGRVVIVTGSSSGLGAAYAWALAAEGASVVLNARRAQPLGEPDEAAPLVVLLASERWSRLNGLFLSLGGDKLSIWDRAREVRCAFKEGGRSLEELDRSIEFALGTDLNAGWNVWHTASPST